MGVDPTVPQSEIGSASLVGAFSVITNLRMELFQALVTTHLLTLPRHLATKLQAGVAGTIISLQDLNFTNARLEQKLRSRDMYSCYFL